MSFVNPTPEHDPHLHLEENTDQTLTWVQERSQATLKHFASPTFDQDYTTVFSLLSAPDKLITATKHGDYAYDFYTDAQHPRGLWRRTPWETYQAWTTDTAEPTWETLLDIDTLCQTENQSWVFGGANHLTPDHDRALVTLHPGGSDAAVIREFDLTTASFVEDGFYFPESKGNMDWIDRDSVLVSADFGPDSLTAAGYPRSVRLLSRGQTLEEATPLYTGEPTDMIIDGYTTHTPGHERIIIVRYLDFRTSHYFELDPTSHHLTQLKIPDSATPLPLKNWLLITLRDPLHLDGTNYPAGSCLALPWEDALNGLRKENIHTLFTPSDQASLQTLEPIASGAVFTTLDTLQTRLWVALMPDGDTTAEDQSWQVQELNPHIGNFNTITPQAVDPDHSDHITLTVTGFLTPQTLYQGHINTTPEAISLTTQETRSTPQRFNPQGLEVRQRWATSEDGTQIPYFVVGKTENLDGTSPAPTLLSGYGGFEISSTPFYLSTYGKTLLEAGHTYALANIRGGGEFGPAWHQAALRNNRHRSYQDFAAVARDLVHSNITTVPQLTAMGGSNGGLLIGNMYTLYPQLFGNLICMVPLLDMKRFSHLLAGASWMDEYGNPDTTDWEFIKTFSPYHNLQTGQEHPNLLITTSTKDDRVHPGHARKFQALLEDAGLNSHYYENTEGGHAGAADSKQSALLYALIFSFIKENS